MTEDQWSAVMDSNYKTIFYPLSINILGGKESTKVGITQNMGKERKKKKFLLKIEEISGGKARKNTWQLI